MRVCVVGLGYIGLPTALILAANGVTVMAVDYNRELIERLQSGSVTFEEKGLAELFDKAVRGSIKFQCDYAPADIYIIAVPTPYEADTKIIDASYVVNAVEKVLEISPKGAIIVIESTVSPGTMDRCVRPAIEAKGYTIGEDIHLVHAPERIIPGNMIYELENNSRTIGSDDYLIGKTVAELYASFCKGNIIQTDIRTAEMTKVIENTYRDVNIAFANELAMVCRKAGLDVYEIIRIANMHPRVNILQPGPGVGGHCISVDPWFLVGDFPQEAKLIEHARMINTEMPTYVLSRIKTIMDNNGIANIERVGLYGLTYKENVDDTRESPTLQLLEVMREHLGREVPVYDPMVGRKITAEQYFDFDAFLEAVDMVVVLVGHTHIKENLDKLAGKVVFDTRNVSNGDGKNYKL